MNSDLAKIPSIHDLILLLKNEYPRIDPSFLKILIEESVSAVKSDPQKYNLGDKNRQEITVSVKKYVRDEIQKLTTPSFRRVINGTGVILHTGLGRAPLGSLVIKSLLSLQGYTNLEIDVDSGKRGERLDHITPLLKRITAFHQCLDHRPVVMKRWSCLCCQVGIAQPRQIFL